METADDLQQKRFKINHSCPVLVTKCHISNVHSVIKTVSVCKQIPVAVNNSNAVLWVNVVTGSLDVWLQHGLCD